jgi:hypothetical protein
VENHSDNKQHRPDNDQAEKPMRREAQAALVMLIRHARTKHQHATDGDKSAEDLEPHREIRLRFPGFAHAGIVSAVARGREGGFEPLAVRRRADVLGDS